MSLERVSLEACPSCGGALTEDHVHQPALLRHGGYGATRRDVVARCEVCGWAVWRERSDVKP